MRSHEERCATLYKRQKSEFRVALEKFIWIFKFTIIIFQLIFRIRPSRHLSHHTLALSFLASPLYRSWNKEKRKTVIEPTYSTKWSRFKMEELVHLSKIYFTVHKRKISCISASLLQQSSKHNNHRRPLLCQTLLPWVCCTRHLFLRGVLVFKREVKVIPRPRSLVKDEFFCFLASALACHGHVYT